MALGGKGEANRTREKEKPESDREKEDEDVGNGRTNRRRRRRKEGPGGGGVTREYTPYDGVGMREPARVSLSSVAARIEWRVWYVSMRAR